MIGCSQRCLLYEAAGICVQFQIEIGGWERGATERSEDPVTRNQMSPPFNSRHPHSSVSVCVCVRRDARLAGSAVVSPKSAAAIMRRSPCPPPRLPPLGLVTTVRYPPPSLLLLLLSPSLLSVHTLQYCSSVSRTGRQDDTAVQWLPTEC